LTKYRRRRIKRWKDRKNEGMSMMEVGEKREGKEGGKRGALRDKIGETTRSIGMA
jgi:hypothetical protein